jgi:nucleoside phosphorylase
MARKLIKVGDKTSSGYVVAEVLGQGPSGVVFISKDNQIRWHYYKNKGRLPDELGIVVARFDSLLVDIKSIKRPLADKLHLYELAGKTLYLAFESSDPPNPVTAFSDVERRIMMLAAQENSLNSSRPVLSADIVVVCALHSPELENVLALSATAEGPRIAADPQTYHSTEWKTEGGTALRVVLAAPNQMGLTASGVLTAKMIMQFRPKLVIMAGIAAGTKHGTQGFGDIVTPEHTFDYGDGKSIDSGETVTVLTSPKPLSIQARLLGRLKEWQRTRKGLDLIARAWLAAKPATALNLHTGPIFSVPTVQQTSKTIDKALLQWRKLSAIEMEAHAVHRACTDTVDPPPLFLCAKSICDFAKNKGDQWQHYAAFTSARFVHDFVAAEWERLIDR